MVKTRYFVVSPSGNNCEVKEIEDNYWFTNPLKEEGRSHRYMAVVEQISHWNNRRSLSSSDSITLEIYTYGEKKAITINGWRFPHSGISANYALTDRFTGMELWFKCTTPDGKEINWYKNDRESASPHHVIITFFKEINRISQYRTEEEAKKHTNNEPFFHVRH